MSRIDELRSTIASLLEEGPWSAIKERFATVRLPWRPDLDPGNGKKKYIQRVLQDLQESELIDLGKRCRTSLPDDGRTRHIEDLLWWIESGGLQEISLVTRSSLADAFDGRVLTPQQDLNSLLGSLGFTRPGGALEGYSYGDDGQLYHHPMHFFIDVREPSCHRAALNHFGFFSWSDRRVLAFAELLVRPEIRRGDEQTEWVELLNTYLRRDGFHLRNSATISGHAVYSAQRIQLVSHARPKNVIFASNKIGFKPVLGLVDALNNDIIVLENEDTCLIYDDPVPDEGLSWKTIVEWWAKRQGSTSLEEARKSLGSRLQEAITSLPEREFFSAYFRTMKPRLEDNLPALLPQVYVYYDPKTQKERGDQRKFLVQRMDFLLLLPENRRVVIEIDGKQHYSAPRPPTIYDFVVGIDGESIPQKPMMLPSPQVYADTVKADRDLRLRGYDVYRFGGHELPDKSCEELVSEFLETLFRLHRLIT